jgi:hypothetical protein
MIVPIVVYYHRITLPRQHPPNRHPPNHTNKKNNNNNTTTIAPPVTPQLPKDNINILSDTTDQKHHTVHGTRCLLHINHYLYDTFYSSVKIQFTMFFFLFSFGRIQQGVIELQRKRKKETSKDANK